MAPRGRRFLLSGESMHYKTLVCMLQEELSRMDPLGLMEINAGRPHRDAYRKVPWLLDAAVHRTLRDQLGLTLNACAPVLRSTLASLIKEHGEVRPPKGKL